ncbi:MAG: hypothetical protein SGJ09_06835 [Phycisphaerae bacterium]|nr:hypothetical protein [Phycisphaerae bacterium]
MLASDRSKNNARAGLFVVGSVVLALAVFITLQKLSFTATHPYQVRFTVESGVGGLSRGSEVRIGGLKRGEVLAIVPSIEGGALNRLDVDVVIDASITLYTNARVVRVAPLLGSGAWLNFVSVGGPDELSEEGPPKPVVRLGANEALDAFEAPGLLTTIVGSRSAHQIVSIIDRTAEFSKVLPEIPGDYRSKVVPAIDAASTTLVQLRDDYGRWRGTVDETLVAATNAAKNLEDGARAATEFVANANATLAENRPRLANTLTNLESASATAKQAVEDVRTTTLPQVSKTLGEGERSLSELATLIDRVDAEVSTSLPQVRSFMADARTAAQQLKLATIEVRRSPWRLLYRPTTDVLAHEQLYESTRTFALATGDLRAASDGIAELLKTRPDLMDADPALRARLQQSLVDALTKYEEAQRRLYGVLTQEP